LAGSGAWFLFAVKANPESRMAILQVPSEFPTIAAAESAAGPGDTIVIDPAYGSETVSVSVDGLTVQAATGTGHLKINLSAPDITLIGSRPFDVTGNDADNIIDASGAGSVLLRGGEGDDELLGGDEPDRLYGGLGNDHLYGYHGNDILISNNGQPFDDHDTDIMHGGQGDDIYRVDGEDDEVHEQAGEGIDRVQVCNNFTLAAGSEVEIIVWRGGFDPVTITGNEFANRIIGSSMNDTLNGGDGNDVLLGGDGDDALNGGAGNDKMYGGGGHDSFDGGDGIDTVSFARSQFAANVDLNAQLILNDAEGSGFNESIVNVENLTGSNSSDILRGDGNANRIDGGLGMDMLRGNSGDDVILGGGDGDQITGGAGADRLTGGSGNDTFIYTSTGDSTVAGSGRDFILDFLQGADRISLSQIDADTATSGNQAFSFIGSSAFSNVAGELRQSASGAYTLIQGDVNGDGAADFAILLKGTYSLGSGDFNL
jgi:Ca2+-binding RTX toxin-like protein